VEGVDTPNLFTLRNIPDSERIKRFVDEQRPGAAVIAGGGFIGLEMGENLVERGGIKGQPGGRKTLKRGGAA